MPRTARLNAPGGVFHVVSRFALDQWLLDRDGARAAYLELLGKAAATSGVEVLGYCLMSNHVHLVVVQGEPTLERFLKSLHTGFAGWVHRSAARGKKASKARGPVFAGRPRMVLVERDNYLLELLRYVHNNPVRAKRVRFARSSPWSSHPAYVGRVVAPEWLRMGYVLDRFGRDPARARERFDAFVNDGRSQERRVELSGAGDSGEAARARRTLGDGHRRSDGVLGSEAFVTRVVADARRVAAALSSRGTEKRAGAIGRPPVRAVIDAVLELAQLDAVELEQRPRARVCAEAKRLAIWVWIHEYAGRQMDVARALSLDTSVVSRYYGQAMRAPGDFDERATAVKGLIDKRTGPRKARVTKATERSLAVRYHVDVDET